MGVCLVWRLGVAADFQQKTGARLCASADFDMKDRDLILSL